jgi:multicomponent Na+:H+ antiporter subunit G
MIGQVVALVGSLLVMVAGIGVVRFRDSMSRLHALTKASTLGVVLVLLGAALFLDRPNDWTSLLLAAVLQLATSPLSAALISRSTYLVSTDDPEEDLEQAVSLETEE